MSLRRSRALAARKAVRASPLSSPTAGAVSSSYLLLPFILTAFASHTVRMYTDEALLQN